MQDYWEKKKKTKNSITRRKYQKHKSQNAVKYITVVKEGVGNKTGGSEGQQKGEG